MWCTITASNRLHRRSHWNQSHVMTQYPKRKEEITSGCGKPGYLPPTGCNHCNVNGNSAVLGLHHNFKNRTIPTFHFSAERYNQIFCYIAAHFKKLFLISFFNTADKSLQLNPNTVLWKPKIQINYPVNQREKGYNLKCSINRTSVQVNQYVSIQNTWLDIYILQGKN